MPYIKQRVRDNIDDDPSCSHTAGQLNYFVTRACLDYMTDNPDYAEFNEVIGVLECAKLELYRRMVAPYEDRKCEENGDVYPSE